MKEKFSTKFQSALCPRQRRILPPPFDYIFVLPDPAPLFLSFRLARLRELFLSSSATPRRPFVSTPSAGIVSKNCEDFLGDDLFWLIERTDLYLQRLSTIVPRLSNRTIVVPNLRIHSFWIFQTFIMNSYSMRLNFFLSQRKLPNSLQRHKFNSNC